MLDFEMSDSQPVKTGSPENFHSIRLCDCDPVPPRFPMWNACRGAVSYHGTEQVIFKNMTLRNVNVNVNANVNVNVNVNANVNVKSLAYQLLQLYCQCQITCIRSQITKTHVKSLPQLIQIRLHPYLITYNCDRTYISEMHR